MTVSNRTAHTDGRGLIAWVCRAQPTNHVTMSPERRRPSKMTREVDGTGRMGDLDEVKKNDIEMTLNKPNSVVAVA